MKLFKTLQIFCFSCILFAVQSCNAKENVLLTAYGKDASYFLALKELPDNQDKAENLLKKSIKHSSPVIARNAYEKYITLGSRKDRIKRHIDYYNQYQDEKALFVLCNELFNDEEYTKVIQYTDSIDVTSCDNKLAVLRFDSLKSKNDLRFDSEYTEWCLERPFSAEHYKYFCSLPSSASEINFRAAVYSQDYAKAFSVVRDILSEDSTYTLTKYLMSDIGKALLWGSEEYAQNAWFIQSKTETVPEDSKFYTYFYAGRLFDKAGNYSTLAVNNLLKAMETSSKDTDYDNALWYVLTILLKKSPAEAVKAVQTYKDKWHSPSYFDDFFDTLSVRLFSGHHWESFYTLAKEIDGYASDEVTAKYCYISARLIEEGFLKTEENTDSNKQEILISRLYTRALRSGSDLYYRTVAAAKLNLSFDGFRKYFFSDKNRCIRNKDAETLLCGYADFGFIDEIYSEWQNYSNETGLECSKKIASFLKECGSEENDYYTKSLRIASRKLTSIEAVPDEQMISLIFPRDFSEAVSDNCSRFELPEYLMYALIRSESFFNPIVKSNKQAMGLTQLMELTANDISRKLKVAEYNLADSSTNIMFGAYYLEEMRRRNDNSNILALFSYNAGINRVRTWVKSADLEFGTESLPKDLFLEVLPFSETREYGRKLVSAASIYGCLYYDKSIKEVVEEILN